MHYHCVYTGYEMCNDIADCWYFVELLCCLLRIQLVRGVTGIFFWGGKVIFPDFFPGVKCFFPVENFHFGRYKTNFRWFQKWKTKKKKKKGHHLFINFFFFYNFPTSISNFPPSLLQFSSQFSPLFPFFLASFFPIHQQKFPGQKSRGEGTLCPLPPACYATATCSIQVTSCCRKAHGICHVYCNF